MLAAACDSCAKLQARHDMIRAAFEHTFAIAFQASRARTAFVRELALEGIFIDHAAIAPAGSVFVVRSERSNSTEANVMRSEPDNGRSKTAAATILGRVLSKKRGVPAERARGILELGTSDVDKKRSLRPVAKQQKGSITGDEMADLESYVQMRTNAHHGSMQPVTGSGSRPRTILVFTSAIVSRGSLNRKIGSVKYDRTNTNRRDRP